MMIASLLAGLLPKLIAVAVACGTLLAVYLGIRRSGRQQQQAIDAATALKDAKVRTDVETDTAGKSDAAVADDLRKHWTR
jgi:hypothetical protein